MGTRNVNFRLPGDLVDKADVVAELTDKNRTGIVKDALRRYLEDIEDGEKFKEKVVGLYLGDEIDFGVLKEFIGRQDAESVRASKELLERGDEIADDLAELRLSPTPGLLYPPSFEGSRETRCSGELRSQG
jgi:predicted DNA-binding protein